MRPSRLLGHHLVQAPDDRPPGRHPHRQAKTKGVDRHRVGGTSSVEVVNPACKRLGEDVVVFCMLSVTGTMTAHSPQPIETHLQRGQVAQLRVDVLHMFYMRSDTVRESSDTASSADTTSQASGLTPGSLSCIRSRSARPPRRCGQAGPGPGPRRWRAGCRPTLPSTRFRRTGCWRSATARRGRWGAPGRRR